MGTTTALELNKRVHQSMGDYLAVVTTTNITTDSLLVSTTLNQYDGAEDGYFEDWWAYVASENNDGVNRKVKNYYTANATMEVYGAVFSADTNVADIRLHRFSYDDVHDAINDSIREIYPALHQVVQDVTTQLNYQIYEYAIPNALLNGSITQLQANIASLPLDETQWRTVWGWDTVNADAWVRIPNTYSTDTVLKMTGYIPLDVLPAATNTIATNDEGQVSLLVAYSKYKFYQMHEQPVSSEDITRYESQQSKSFNEYRRLLPRGRMAPPPGQMKL